MTKKKSDWDAFDERDRYYDHEPMFKRLMKRGAKGWVSQGTQAEFKKIWNLFNSTDMLGKKKGEALDFGCGGGEFSALLAAKGYNVLGIDYSKTAIRMANRQFPKAKVPNAKFRQADAVDLKSELGPFDLIASVHVLHCLIGKDRHTYLANVRDMLNPGGKLMLTCMVDFPKSGNFLKRIDRKTRIDDHHHRYFASEPELKRELKQAGLSPLFQARETDDSDANACDEWYVLAQRK